MAAAALPLRRAAKWIAAGALLLLLASAVELGAPSQAEWWVVAILLVGWEAGPILLAAACAHGSRTLAGQIAFLALAFAFILYAATVHLGVRQSSSSTAPVAFVIYPLFGYCVWLAVAAAAALFGWRLREDWLSG